MTAKLSSKVAAPTRTKRRKKSSLKKTTIALYAGAFMLVVSLIAAGYDSPKTSTILSSATEVSDLVGSPQEASLSEVLAVAIAADVAETTNLPVARNVAELSVSLAAKNEVAVSTDTSVSKQQAVPATADRREIVTHTAAAGETLDVVAGHYGVSKDTIKWANNLTSDAVDAGKQLIIPPVDGVVYTVKDGDTVEKIAEKYKASADRIVAFNNLELGGLTKDTKILIPAGELPEVERPGYVAPRPTYSYSYSTSSANVSSSSNFMSGSVGNRYAYGYCTWYAYERRAAMGRPVGSFWGNANTWASAARSQGFAVNKTPAAGAVFQTSYGGGGYGHVGIIESVDHAAGTVTYSDMNGGAGWNRIGGGTVSIAEAQSRWTFIH